MKRNILSTSISLNNGSNRRKECQSTFASGVFGPHLLRDGNMVELNPETQRVLESPMGLGLVESRWERLRSKLDLQGSHA